MFIGSRYFNSIDLLMAYANFSSIFALHNARGQYLNLCFWCIEFIIHIHTYIIISYSTFVRNIHPSDRRSYAGNELSLKMLLHTIYVIVYPYTKYIKRTIQIGKSAIEIWMYIITLIISFLWFCFWFFLLFYNLSYDSIYIPPSQLMRDIVSWILQ